MANLAKIVREIDKSQPWYSFLYTAILFTTVIAMGVTRDWSSSLARWPILTFFILLGVLAEIFYVALPSRTGRVSVCFAIDMGAILLFSPEEAALVSGTSYLVANFIERRALDVMVFNASQTAITTGITALFWQRVWPSPTIVPVPDGALPVLVAGLIGATLVYYFLNVSLVGIGVSLAWGLPFSSFLTKDVLWTIPNYLALSSLGFLVAILYLNIGVLGIILLWVPLLLARYSFQQYMNIRAAHLETIQALAEALDAKDPYTRGHSDRVAKYAVELGRELKLSEHDVEMLHYAGILHDIGKIGISDTVLNKVGKLTDEEFKLIQSHTVIGDRMVRPVTFLRGVAQVIRHHHERYDGRGYPDGIKGEEIPIGARIMAVADAFDAMTYDRVYRAGMSTEKAVDELIKGKGTQFDPKIVDLFVSRVLPRLYELTQDTAAKRHQTEHEVKGDQVWRYFPDQSEGSAAKEASAAGECGERDRRRSKGAE